MSIKTTRRNRCAKVKKPASGTGFIVGTRQGDGRLKNHVRKKTKGTRGVPDMSCSCVVGVELKKHKEV